MAVGSRQQNGRLSALWRNTLAAGARQDHSAHQVADRLDRLRAETCGLSADFLRTEPFRPAAKNQDQKTKEQARGPVERVETRGIEPLTPALQRRCSAN